jgi:lipoprotein NlpI
MEREDLEHAIADDDAAIRIDANFGGAYANRGRAYQRKSDDERAIADFDMAIRLDAKNASALRSRSLSRLHVGKAADALADIDRASELDSKNAYYALWADIVAHRNNVATKLPQTAPKVDMTVWPAPVIRMFLGEISPAAMLAAATDANPKQMKNHVCEANFYGAALPQLRDGCQLPSRLPVNPRNHAAVKKPWLRHSKAPAAINDVRPTHDH